MLELTRGQIEDLLDSLASYVEIGEGGHPAIDDICLDLARDLITELNMFNNMLEDL